MFSKIGKRVKRNVEVYKKKEERKKEGRSEETLKEDKEGKKRKSAEENLTDEEELVKKKNKNKGMEKEKQEGNINFRKANIPLPQSFNGGSSVNIRNWLSRLEDYLLIMEIAEEKKNNLRSAILI